MRGFVCPFAVDAGLGRRGRCSRESAPGTLRGGLDAIIRTSGMDADELEDLMLQVRVLYRGGEATERQERFLADLARSLDDQAIDARP